MVNGAYVAAVEAEDAAAVIRSGIELVDEADGRDPRGRGGGGARPAAGLVPHRPRHRLGRAADDAGGRGAAGPDGVAGYAIDVEDQEQARADLNRFVRAQRDMLDRLSAGVAQFGRDRSLIFFNQPFARLFSLAATFLADRPEFDRVIDAMREAGNLPEVRDFPDWKEEHRALVHQRARAPRRRTGCCPAASICASSPSRCPTAACSPSSRTGPSRSSSPRRATPCCACAPRRSTICSRRSACSPRTGGSTSGTTASRELWGLEEEQLAAHPRVDALTPLLAPKLKRASHAGLVRELVRSATVERKQRSGRVVADRRARVRVRRGAAARRQRARSPCSTSPTAGRSRRRFGTATRRSRKPTG